MVCCKGNTIYFYEIFEDKYMCNFVVEYVIHWLEYADIIIINNTDL